MGPIDVILSEISSDIKEGTRLFQCYYDLKKNVNVFDGI